MPNSRSIWVAATVKVPLYALYKFRVEGLTLKPASVKEDSKVEWAMPFPSKEPAPEPPPAVTSSTE
jgi:hypothetical protein